MFTSLSIALRGHIYPIDSVAVATGGAIVGYEFPLQTIPPYNRLFIPTNSTDTKLFNKHRFATLDYGVNFSKCLNGQEIINFDVMLQSGPIVLEKAYHNKELVVAIVSGGTPYSISVLTFKAYTAALVLCTDIIIMVK